MKGRFSTSRSAGIIPEPQAVPQGVFHGSVQGISLPMSAQPTQSPKEDELYGPQCQLLTPHSQRKNQKLLENQTALNCSLTGEKEEDTADRKKGQHIKVIKILCSNSSEVPDRLVLRPLLWSAPRKVNVRF